MNSHKKKREESKREITGEVLNKIEDKLWKNLEELNKDEKKWIEHGNSSHYSMSHFSDSYKYISRIHLLQELKEVVNDDKIYIRYYGLEEFETEEETEECKTKRAINAIKREYELELESLFTEDCTKKFGKGYGATIFSAAHYFEAGIDTLNKLEKRLGD